MFKVWAYRLSALVPTLIAVTTLSLTAFAQTADYSQPYRPQIHFSPQHNWTNDPNGLVYFRGEYHLFYQFNPFGDQWGHMSWGHAVSKDLLHWEELPVAIPEENGIMIFTGSVVVDRANTSGLCTAKTECLIAVYTGYSKTAKGSLQTQNIASSQDNGRTWSKYTANPVLDLHMEDFRDPSVFWDEREHHWMMSVSLPKEHKVRFYSSPNLKQWTQLGEFGPAGDVDGDWECPDLLRIPPDNENRDGKRSVWALKVGLNPGAPQGGSGEQYFLGDFDGKTFTASLETGSHGWTNYGKDDYCAISYNGLPKGQDPILLGWMSNWQYAAKLPTSPWRGQMSLPRRLTFLKDAAGIALKQEPVVAPLRGKTVSFSSTAGIDSLRTPYEAHLQFGRPTATNFGVRVYSDESHWTEIGYDTVKQQFYIDRTQSGLPIDKDFPCRTTAPIVASRSYDLKLIVDRSSVEAFAQNGTIAVTDLIFPLKPESKIQFFPDDPSASKFSGQIWELKSIWPVTDAKRK